MSEVTTDFSQPATVTPVADTRPRNEDGSINWRALIPDEFLYVNKEWFERRGQVAPESIEGLEDAQLLVKLGGIKHVAKLRGYRRVKYDVVKASLDHVVVVCSIDWIDGWEADQNGTRFNVVTYDGIGAAHQGNTNSFMLNFLEAAAENRAFVRAVRNFLNINIVGDDEIIKGKGNVQNDVVADAPSDKPQDLVRAAAKKRGLDTKEDMLKFLEEAQLDESILKKFNESGLNGVGARDCRTILAILNK